MARAAELTIHQCRVFDVVARNGSLSGAASVLNLPQPSISRLIARLEREIGTPLFDRSSAGVALTAAGEQFLKNARMVSYYHDLAIEEAKAFSGRLVGDVRIAAPDSVGTILFAPFVRRLKTMHPEVRLRTIASQSVAIPAMLASESIDIGIVADTHVLPNGIREPLFKEHLYLVGPRTSPLLRKKEVRVVDTAHLPLVINAMPGGFRKLIDRAFAEAGIAPNVKVEMDANAPLVELLTDGEGYSILPYSLVASAPKDSPLRASLLIEPTMTRTLSVIVAPNKPATSAVREAIRTMRSIVKELSDRARWIEIERPPDHSRTDRRSKLPR